MSKIRAIDPLSGAVGAGLPAAVMPCQIKTPIRKNVPRIRRMGKIDVLAGDV
jgi:hypothetical protein